MAGQFQVNHSGSLPRSTGQTFLFMPKIVQCQAGGRTPGGSEGCWQHLATAWLAGRPIDRPALLVPVPAGGEPAGPVPARVGCKAGKGHMLAADKVICRFAWLAVGLLALSCVACSLLQWKASLFLLSSLITQSPTTTTKTPTPRRVNTDCARSKGIETSWFS